MSSPSPPYPVTIEFPTNWGEMDALGHVNNARFFAWFESARIAYAARIKLVATPEVGPILATTTCDFLKPVVHPADVVVGTRVTGVGNTSFTMDYGVWHKGAPEELVARGSSVAVFVKYATGEKLRIPEEMRAAIAELEARVGPNA